EEGRIAIDAEALERADGDDAVELALHLPVVLERELHGGRKALLAGPVLGDGQLLGAERHALDATAGVGRKPQRQAAPATPDVEPASPRRKGHLGGEVNLLGELRLGEIGARLEI